MKKMSEITRRDIFDIIQGGFDKQIDTVVLEPYYERQMPSFETVHIYMPYHGRFSEIDFLDRLYHLDDMPSTDRRYKSARGDIYCHTINFNDWPDFWFLDDNRFELKDGFEDEPLLRFLCEMLHPAVRDEEGPWKDYLEKFNQLLRQDGYEIYASYRVSGRDIYKAHEYLPVPQYIDEGMLFTKRYRDLVYSGDGRLCDLICQNIDDKTKGDLISALEEFSELQKWHPNRYDSYEISTDAMYMALRKLNELQGISIIELSEEGLFGNRYTSRLGEIFTPYLFDLIELQHEQLSTHEKVEFREKINSIFHNAHVEFCLTIQGLIERILAHEVIDNTIGQDIGLIKEIGLRELLDQAIDLHQRPGFTAHRDAMVKLWDAFERLKSYYTNLDKKGSASKIVADMAGGSSDYSVLFETEFKALTTMGNDFRIRHHETSKVDIPDPRYYDYFFNRCLSLIALAIQYLQ